MSIESFRPHKQCYIITWVNLMTSSKEKPLVIYLVANCNANHRPHFLNSRSRDAIVLSFPTFIRDIMAGRTHHLMFERYLKGRSDNWSQKS